MPTGHYRFRRSLGNVGSRFRGARPDTYPLYTGVLDSYPGAAAAYSLRALSRGWLAGDVVEVRRSSDSTSQDFTASQITNGQMLSWVNTDPDPYSSDFSAGVDGFDANLGTVAGNIDGIGGEDNNLRYTVDTASSNSHDASRDDELTVGQDFQITGEFYIPSGQNSIDGIRIMDGAAGFQDRYETPALDTWVSFDTGAVTPANVNLQFRPLDGGSNTVFDATGTDVFYLRNITVTQLTADGFVSTWYDQSGNANDATQIATASQPKIVDAGALVTGGLDFDGVDDSFGMSNLFSGTTAVAQFAVGNADTTGTAEAIIGQGSLSSPLGGAWHVTSEIAFRCAGNSIYDDDFIDANLLLLSTLVAASSTSADVEMFLDGVALGQTGTSSTALDFTTSSANIGVSSGGAYYDGRIAEIIVYDSDQTANRVGIETNINDHYSIYA